MNLEGLTNGSMLDFEALGYGYDDLSAPSTWLRDPSIVSVTGSRR
ncbi:MAG: hypothetical protein AAGF92_12175 [Myxococcota bacterium]